MLLYHEGYALRRMVNSGLNPMFVVPLFGDLEGFQQGHLDATRRILARDSTRPEPRNYGGIAAIGQLCLRVEMPNPLKRFFAQPRTVVADVIRKAGRAAPRETLLFFTLAYHHSDAVCVGIDWRAVAELRWYLDQCLVDENSHRVEV